MDIGQTLHKSLLEECSVLFKRVVADGNYPTVQKWRYIDGSDYYSMLAVTSTGRQLVYYTKRQRGNQEGIEPTISIYDPLAEAALDGDFRFDVRPVSQNDFRWRAVEIGRNRAGTTLTIGNWGCLLVVYLMWLKYHKFVDYDVLALRQAFIDVGRYRYGYFAGGDLRRAFPNHVIDERWTARKNDEDLTPRIADYMRAHRTPVCIRVDYKPATTLHEQHWVLAIGIEGGDLIIADPDDGQIVPLPRRFSIDGGDILEALWLRPMR